MASQKINKRAKMMLKTMNRTERKKLLKAAETLFAVELITLKQMQKIARGISQTPYTYGETGKGY